MAGEEQSPEGFYPLNLQTVLQTGKGCSWESYKAPGRGRTPALLISVFCWDEDGAASCTGAAEALCITGAHLLTLAELQSQRRAEARQVMGLSRNDLICISCWAVVAQAFNHSTW